MGRPKGAKNKRTLLREAEQKLLSVKREDFLDAMVVLEESMRHFYIRAVMLKTANGDPKEIDDNLLKAVDIAVQIMPYRHHRLAAIKLDKDPVMGELHENASLAELEAELKKHWKRLAPVLDLEALVAPSDGWRIGRCRKMERQVTRGNKRQVGFALRQSLGLGKYEAAFRENEIDETVLPGGRVR